jgi:Gram-negative bacterial TonB protein C-terminal
MLKNNLRRLLGSILFLPMTMTVAIASVGAGGQEAKGVLPSVVTIGVPTYPAVARVAHIEGIVHMRITTDGRRVTTAEVQDGPRVLAVSAQENVRTWQFSPHDPTTFPVTYQYKLVSALSIGIGNTSVTLGLPTNVEVSAMPPANVDYSPDK